jgi:hypothetical protein
MLGNYMNYWPSVEYIHENRPQLSYDYYIAHNGHFNVLFSEMLQISQMECSDERTELFNTIKIDDNIIRNIHLK